MQTRSRAAEFDRREEFFPRRWSAARRYRVVGYWMALTDTAAYAAATIVSLQFIHGSVDLSPNRTRLVLLALLAQVAIFVSFRLYSVSRLGAAEEFRRLLEAVTMSVLAIVVISFWLRARPGRVWILLTWAGALLLVLIGRRVWHTWMVRARRDGRLAYRTLIVGGNEEAERLAETLRARYLGFQVLGYVSTDQGRDRIERTEFVGPFEGLQEAIRGSEADCLFVVSSAVTPEQMSRVVRISRTESVELRLSANISNIAATRLNVQPLNTMMALTLKPVKLTGVQAATKRAIDVVLSAIALTAGLPLFGLIALASKVDSRGPLFYRQERIGRHGKPFAMLKFRTMVVNADQMAEQLRHLSVAQGALLKIPDDPRVTRVGRHLRRWSLDELPQLGNVLKGEMSLVGPRPPLPREVALYEDWHFDRLEVLPGMTGLWQVSRQGEIDFDEYVRLDLYYIENWSISFDLFIMLKTFPHLITRKGEF